MIDKAAKDMVALKEAVEFMDCLSQAAFNEIELVARLTLRYMEHPDCYSHLDEIGDALTFILGKAQSAMNDINCTAENVGCQFDDENAGKRSRARADAHRQALGPAMEVQV